MPRVIDDNAVRDWLGLTRARLMEQAGPDLISDPKKAEALTNWLDAQIQQLDDVAAHEPVPPDRGLGELAGVGPTSAVNLGQTRLPVRVAGYDDTVASERIQAMADLYYIYQHERVGVFRALRRLQ